MPNTYVNKVQLADGTSLLDISDTTATASDVLNSKYFYTAAGEKVQGTATGSGAGAISISDTADSAGGTIRTITAVDISEDTVTAGSMLYGTTAHDASGDAITGSIVTKTGTDLTASGDTVTVPAGYYASQATKAVASGTEGTPTATKGTVSSNSVTITPSVTNTAGYISGGTHTGTGVTVSASELVSGNKAITSAGTGIDVANYATASVASGTVTAPASISGTSATVSTGTNTLTLSKTVSVTPSVTTAGYVSAGTAGNSSVSLTASVNTRSSSDLTASNLTVTAPAGYYGSSATKTLSDQNLIAENIKKDVVIFGTTGTYEGGGGGTTWETVYQGTVNLNSFWGDGTYYGWITPWSEAIAQNSVWRVTWDNSSYECNATWEGSPDGNPYAIGNYTYDGGSGGTEYPFFMQPYYGSQLAIVGAYGNHNVVIEKQVSSGGSTLITKTITQNGTYDAEDDDADGYSSVTVNVSGSSKNVQTAQTTDRRNSTSLGSIISLTCSTTGTYDVYWTCARSNTSQTWGSQLYIGGSSYGTENTTWSNNVQNNHLENVSISANQTVAVYGRSRSGYYIHAPQLTIVQK